MFKKLIHCIIRKSYYLQSPMYCFEKKEYVYLVQWEFLKTFPFKREYFTLKELISQGIEPKNIKLKK